jgi:formate hydrogenlyase subunit 3/multisubunit Na+/H+ antiporter MnhD subunit
VMSGVMMYLAFVLITIYEPGTLPERVSPARLTLALLVIGFGLRIAIVPFHTWLPDLVEHASPLVTALIVVVINTSSLWFLVQSLQFFPIIVFENSRGLQIIMGIGVVTALVAAILALAQEQMRQMVGYLFVHNAGFLLFGLGTAQTVGMVGMLFEAFSQLPAILLILISVAMLERPDGRPANVLRRDLLWRWPVAATGFLGGLLALLGMPPFGGFVGKWMLYQAAQDQATWLVIPLLAATAIAVLAVVRIARERLFGPADDLYQDEPDRLLGETEIDRPQERRLQPESAGLAILVMVLLGMCFMLGLYPQPLLSLIQNVVDGLSFIQA